MEAAIRRHWPFALSLLAVVATRLWFVNAFPIVQVSDYSAYYNEARGLAGLGSPGLTALYAIGPKLIYSFPMRVFGDRLLVVSLTNTLLYASAQVVLYAAVVSVFGRATGTLTALVCLFSLSELYFTNLASSETPGTLFVAAVFFAMRRGLETTPAVVGTGVIGGLATYNRSNIFAMGLLAFAQHLLLTRRLVGALRRGAAVQLITFLVTLPLCLFNLRHFGRFTPMIPSSHMFWFGNNPRLSGDVQTYLDVPEDFPVGHPQRERLRREYATFYTNPQPGLELSKLNPYDAAELKGRYGFAWIRSNPGRYLQLILARFQLFFFSCTYGEVPYNTAYDRANPEQPRWTPAHERLMPRVRRPIRRLYQVLISGAAIGLVVSVLRYGVRDFFTSTKGLPLLIVAYYTVPFLLTVAANRNHLPILSLCWIYLAHGLVLLARALRARLAARPRHAPAA